jgi:hypothetical protein
MKEGTPWLDFRIIGLSWLNLKKTRDEECVYDLVSIIGWADWPEKRE